MKNDEMNDLIKRIREDREKNEQAIQSSQAAVKRSQATGAVVQLSLGALSNAIDQLKNEGQSHQEQEVNEKNDTKCRVM